MNITIKQPYGPHQRDLSALCEILQVTPLQFALDLYMLCHFMQREGKHFGMSLHRLEADNKQLINNGDTPIPTYLFNQEYIGSVYQGILYHSDNRKFSGWGINKNDVVQSDKYEVWKWERTWLEKFAYLHPVRAETIQKRLDAIQQANERKPARRHDQHWLEHKTTVQIAHQRELAKLMSIWMFSFRKIHRFDTGFTYLQNIWENQVSIFTAELEYRTEAQPEQRTSKKKTLAAKNDFRTSALWLTGVNKVFSDEFVEMVKQSALPFDLSVDYDNLPKQVPEKSPVMKMGYYQLMHEFMRWVTDNEIDPDSFEAEDAHLLKRKLADALHTALDDHRKTLARMKNQPVPTQEISE